MLVTTHFPLTDFTKSSTAIRLDIENELHPEKSPEDARIVHCLWLLSTHVLEPIRAHFGKPFRPNSAYRCYALEEALCGKSIKRFLAENPGTVLLDYMERKSHPTGQAADIEIPGVRNLDLAKWIEKNLIFDQLILEFYHPQDPSSGWVHVSFREGANRSQVLTISGAGAMNGLPAK